MSPSDPALKHTLKSLMRPVPMPPSGGAGRATPTSITRSDLPRVRLPSPAPSAPSLEDWGDEDSDPITDVVRLAELQTAASPARDRAVLIRMDGAHAGQLCSLGGEPCRMGRHASNDLSIADGGVSRFHARIVHDGAHHTIEDLGSRNGTYVRGQRVMRATLSDGDWIQVGPRVTLRYSMTDSRQETLLRQLYESSTRDALTGAYNRQHFDERMRTEIAYAMRHGTNVSLVMFDIDHFKRINDTNGHLAGDQVLRHIARLAARQLRAEDVFARYGGEEFAVILRGIDVLGALRVAERLRATIEVLPVGWEKSIVRLTISGGCAALSQCERPLPEALVALADTRLYAAKRTGRNRIVASG
jgi:diguanylate cyclase (GGDEF)-like protein